jgi:hypothetical protein
MLYAYIVRGSTQGDASLKRNCTIHIFSEVVSLLMAVWRFLILLLSCNCFLIVVLSSPIQRGAGDAEDDGGAARIGEVVAAIVNRTEQCRGRGEECFTRRKRSCTA